MKKKLKRKRKHLWKFGEYHTEVAQKIQNEEEVNEYQIELIKRGSTNETKINKVTLEKQKGKRRIKKERKKGICRKHSRKGFYIT